MLEISLWINGYGNRNLLSWAWPWKITQRKKLLKFSPVQGMLWTSYFRRIACTFLCGVTQPRECSAIISPHHAQSYFGTVSSTQLPGLSYSCLGTDGFLTPSSKPFFDSLSHFISLFPPDISQIDGEPWQQGCAGTGGQQQLWSQTRCPCTSQLQLGHHR